MEPYKDKKGRCTMSYVFTRGKYEGYSVGDVINEFNDPGYIDFMWRKVPWFRPTIYVRRIIKNKMNNI